VRSTRTGDPTTAADAVAVGCLLVLVGLGCAVAGGSAPWVVDRWATAVTSGLLPAYDVLLAVDLVGEPVGALTAVGLITLACLLAGRYRLAATGPVALALAGLAVGVLKPLFGRTIHGPENLAYPSGHTATATVLALVALLLVVDITRPGRRAGVLVVAAGTVAAAGSMAIVQVALSAHYATDTVGGACLAVVVVVGTVRVTDAVTARVAPRPAVPSVPDPRSTRP
jgi:membrane-associated phospholipid phosphatase